MTVPHEMEPETLEQWDAASLWHPFTPHSVYLDEHPLFVDRGEGNYLVDIRGGRYLDGVASLWCNLFGHCHPEIDGAVRRQLKKIAHSTLLGNTNTTAVEFAHRLLLWTPGPLTRVFFSDNGATSVEVALKMAFQYWQQVEDGRFGSRQKFLALGNAYHGDTIGAVSVGGIDLFHSKFRPLLFEVLRAPSPYCYRCPLGKKRETCHLECLREFEGILRTHKDEIAAVIIEPGFQGAGGIITYPGGYLEGLQKMVQETGTLLILDEVAVGMGRSGHMFACEKEGLSPDFLCLAKGITGGYLPLAVTVTTDQVFEAFLGPPEEAKTFFHGHTYTGNALGCAAGLAVLDLFDRGNFFEDLDRKIRCFQSEIQRLLTYEWVGDVRGYGLAAGVELVSDREEKTPFPAADRIGMKVCNRALERGVFLRPLGDVIVFMPPLSITEPEIRLMVDAVAYGIEKVLAGR